MADVDVAELRRLEQATPGEWLIAPGTPQWVSRHWQGHKEWGYEYVLPDPAAAQFVVAMRNALPALLDAWEERDRLREQYTAADGSAIRWMNEAMRLSDELIAAKARIADLETALAVFQEVEGRQGESGQ